MDRKDILSSPEYWTAKTQVELYSQAQKFMEETGRDKTRLAEYLGVSKGYVSQLLNGDYDHRMSKFFELALAFGVVPKIEFVPIEKIAAEDHQQILFQKIVVDTPKVTEWSNKENQSMIHYNYETTAFTQAGNMPKRVA